MEKKQVQVGLPVEVIELIDQNRGDVARSLYCRKLLIKSFYKMLNKDVPEQYKALV